jgi:hypothetical protein
LTEAGLRPLTIVLCHASWLRAVTIKGPELLDPQSPK